MVTEKGCELSFPSLSIESGRKVERKTKKSIGIKVLVYLFNYFLHCTRRNLGRRTTSRELLLRIRDRHLLLFCFEVERGGLF